ncbi:hypothetical protein NHX12_030597 [Muraenolepis orangiensis]|uniref:Uncharacterized protein n=1 Tax=Muraenolepis orangiensis TaxID=630683 RepID=A0A9Q0EE98_9TELE|nr:hypothetical protein NHX12_030597 [Muraenolepis orangiensis]
MSQRFTVSKSGGGGGRSASSSDLQGGGEVNQLFEGDDEEPTTTTTTDKGGEEVVVVLKDEAGSPIDQGVSEPRLCGVDDGDGALEEVSRHPPGCLVGVPSALGRAEVLRERELLDVGCARYGNTTSDGEPVEMAQPLGGRPGCKQVDEDQVDEDQVEEDQVDEDQVEEDQVDEDQVEEDILGTLTHIHTPCERQ